MNIKEEAISNVMSTVKTVKNSINVQNVIKNNAGKIGGQFKQ